MKKFEHYELLKEMVAKKYVSVQKHPILPLYLYKYTISTPFEKMWNPATMAARGLVLDENGIQYNTPFEKFFNIEELESNGLSLPPKWMDYQVYKKIDGSLIQAFFYNSELVFTSSGSFDSIFAKVAKEIAIEKGYDKLMYDYLAKATGGVLSNSSGLTFLFELLHPNNRIVVNNGNAKDLVLLAVRSYSIDTFQGFYTFDHPLTDRFKGFNIVKKIHMSLSELMEEKNRPDFINEEGFVVVYENGFRVKIKYEEYFRLHKTISNVNEKFVWEFLSEGKDISQLGENIPDETFQFIKDMKAKLEEAYNIKRLESHMVAAKVRYSLGLPFYEVNEDNPWEGIDKKTFALEVTKPEYKKYSGILFRMYEGRDYSDIIWKQIKPKYEKEEGGFQSFKLD